MVLPLPVGPVIMIIPWGFWVMRLMASKCVLWNPKFSKVIRVLFTFKSRKTNAGPNIEGIQDTLTSTD